MFFTSGSGGAPEPITALEKKQANKHKTNKIVTKIFLVL